MSGLSAKEANRLALVTGASSGIGSAYAESLARRGWNLVIVARSAERLAQKAAEMTARHSISIQCLRADLATNSGISAVERRLETGDVDLLVNNAGFASLADFPDETVGAIERMITVNVTALTRLTRSAVTAMKRRGAGTIVNVASGLSFNVMPMAAVYAGTKGFVSQFTQCLAAELAGDPVRLQLLVPGLTRSNLGDAEKLGLFNHFPPEAIMEAEAVAEASIAALSIQELVCIPRLEDHADWETASAAIRRIGIDPPHNELASRYRALAQN